MIFLKGFLFPIAVIALVLLLVFCIIIALAFPIILFFVGYWIYCKYAQFLVAYIALCICLICGYISALFTPGTVIEKYDTAVGRCFGTYYEFLSEEYPFIFEPFSSD